MASSSTSTTYPYPVGVNVKDYVHDVLSGSNYQQWKQQMENLLRETGMVGFIDGTTKAPARKIIVCCREIENEEYEYWKKSNDLVRKWIRDTIRDDIKTEVKRVWTAKGLWTRFENWYGTPTRTAPADAPAPPAPADAPDAPAPADAPAPPAPADAPDAPAPADAPDAPARSRSRARVGPWARVACVVTAVFGLRARAFTPTVVASDVANRFLLLHKAAIEGNWDVASQIIERESVAVRAGITEYLETALIVAVKSTKRNDFVNKLLEKMSPEDVAVGDTRKRTALHRAAGANNREIAEKLVAKNPYLPNAQTLDKRIPLYFAATRGHRDMVLYLLSVTRDEFRPMSSTTSLSQLLSAPRSENQTPTGNDDGTRSGIEEFRWNPTPFDGESGFKILHQLTINGFYDIALALLQDRPQMAHFIPAPKEKQNDIDFHSLLALARKPSSFRSGTSFNWLQSCIYWVVPVTLENNADHQSTGDMENQAGCFTSSGAHAKNILQSMIGKITDLSKKILHWMIWKITYLLPCRKHIEGKKRLHDQAFKLVKFLCNKIANSNHSNAIKIFQLALFQATSLGIVEIVEEILRSYPDAISLQNQKKQSIFHQAIVYRREKVFNLICQMESRTIFLSQLDESNNNALHLAGYMAPQQQLYLRTGAAQQMQRELHWFKEVEKLVVPRSKEERNDRKMTPEEVFIDTHKDLAKEGERSMKDTANACTIVAALIATVAFAAAITVPGGNNSDGNPNFYKQRDFIIFGIFDALAFLLSLTSLLSFMSIHTHSFQYGEHDFLVSLHKIFIVGLYTLFLCILSTVAAFHATLYLVFGERNKPRIIILIFAYCAYMPAVFFVLLNFPLIADMIKSIIFVKGSDVKLS